MTPHCTVVMNKKTLNGEKWNNHTLLFSVLKVFPDARFPILVSEFMEDDKIAFMEPNKTMQEILREWHKQEQKAGKQVGE